MEGGDGGGGGGDGGDFGSWRRALKRVAMEASSACHVKRRESSPLH